MPPVIPPVIPPRMGIFAPGAAPVFLWL